MLKHLPRLFMDKALKLHCLASEVTRAAEQQRCGTRISTGPMQAGVCSGERGAAHFWPLLRHHQHAGVQCDTLLLYVALNINFEHA